MRQVAVFNENINQLANGRLHANESSINTFNLYDNKITCGLLNCGDLKFDGSDAANHHKVLIRKEAFSCNYRDRSLAISASRKIEGLAAQRIPRFYTLGSEFTGRVVALGAQVEGLNIGDRVIGNGNYPYSGYPGVMAGLPTNNGSKELDTFHFSKLVKVPESMPVEVAAGFAIGGQTCYSMIRRLKLQKGEKVLVTAASSNTSLFAISILKQRGVKVYAITTRSKFSDRLKALGADEVFVVSREMKRLNEDEHILNFVKKNGAFDAVIDPFFDIYLSKVVDVIGIGGRYVTCGLYKQTGDEGGNHASSLSHVMLNVMSKNMQLIGNCIGNTEDLKGAIKDYSEGKFEVVIDSVYSNDNVAAFFDRSFNHSDRFGKVIYKY